MSLEVGLKLQRQLRQLRRIAPRAPLQNWTPPTLTIGSISRDRLIFSWGGVSYNSTILSDVYIFDCEGRLLEYVYTTPLFNRRVQEYGQFLSRNI